MSENSNNPPEDIEQSIEPEDAASPDGETTDELLARFNKESNECTERCRKSTDMVTKNMSAIRFFQSHTFLPK